MDPVAHNPSSPPDPAIESPDTLSFDHDINALMSRDQIYESRDITRNYVPVVGKDDQKTDENLDLDTRNRRCDYDDYDDEFDPYDRVERKRRRR